MAPFSGAWNRRSASPIAVDAPTIRRAVGTRATTLVRWAVSVVVGTLAVVAMLGFGSGGSPQSNRLAKGRRLFQVGSYPSCAFCHTMRSAASTSPFADDLDATLLEDTKGKTTSGIERWVLGYIRNATCFDSHDAGRCMPRYLLSGSDAKVAALFIATCGGHSKRPGCEPVATLTGRAADGFHDVQTLGCSGCHMANLAVAIAPSFEGLYGSKVVLDTGKTVVADEAYLVDSILDPNKDTVKGFQHGFMSSRIRPGTVTKAQAEAIVAYLRTLRR
jgi:cytochrome c oxidase subunit 2